MGAEAPDGETADFPGKEGSCRRELIQVHFDLELGEDLSHPLIANDAEHLREETLFEQPFPEALHERC